MNFTLKFLTALVIATALAVSPIVAQEQDVTIADLQASAEDLADALAKALPFNSTVGLNWSDAYIKQFPHFGAGLVLGATFMDAEDISAALENLGYADSGDIEGAMPLPAAALEGRLGGFVWPFDIGFKIGFLPESAGDSLAASGLALDYLLVGFDVRYALLEGGGIKPKVSVGGGFNYLRGGVSTTVDEDQSFTIMANDGEHTLTTMAPEIGLEWKTVVIDLKAQASWKFLIFTPYIGLGLSHGSSTAGYFIDSKVKYDGNDLTDSELQALLDDLAEYNAKLAAAGQPTFDVPDISATGIESSTDVSGWSVRTFGGMSLTPFPFVRIDLTGLYNFAGGDYGFSVGTRIQF